MELEPPGDRLPMGAVSSSDYENIEVVLRAGDVVVFCSDGLVEAPARANGKLPTLAMLNGHVSSPSASELRGEYFGFERLAASAARWSAGGANAHGVAAGIWSDVLDWTTKDSHHDDLTLLVLRVQA